MAAEVSSSSAAVDVGVAAAARDHLRRAVATTIQKWGGVVTDAGGDAWFGFFGVPHLTELDAIHSVAAAIELHRLPPGDTLGALRCAIATGECFVSHDADGTPSITGGAFDRARLLLRHVAVADPVADTATVKKIEALAKVGPTRRVDIPGEVRLEAATITDLERIPERHSRSAFVPLIGRQQELAQMDRVLDNAVATQQAHRVLVVGAPGVGKSHLTRHLVAGLADATVVVMRCPPHRTGGALHPFVDAVAETLQIDRAQSPELVANRIRDSLPKTEERDLVERALSSLLGVAEASIPFETIVYALRAWLGSLRSPLVVVIEDIHWAQEALVDALDHIMLRWSAGPSVFLATARQDFLDTRPDWGTSGATSSVVRLSEIPAADLRAIAEHVLHPLQPSADLMTKLADISKGNPLFAIETLLMLRDNGALTDDGSEVDVAEGEFRPAESLGQIIAARTSTLPEAQLLLLRRCAVIGERFTTSLLEPVLDEHLRPQMRRSLTALVTKELLDVVPGDRPGDDGFAFRHDLIRNVVYEATPRSKRAAGHEAVGRLLSQLDPSDDALVGHHFWAAAHDIRQVDGRDPNIDVLERRAADRFLAAGIEAFASGDFQTAVARLTPVVQIAGVDESVFSEASFLLARALHEIGRGSAAKEVLDAAVSSVSDEAAGARWKVESALLRLKRENVGSQEASRIRDEVLGVISVLDEVGDHLGISSAYQCVAELHAIALEYKRAEDACALAVEHAELAGVSAIANRSRGSLATCAFWGPTPVEDGVSVCRQLLVAVGDDLSMQAFISSLIAPLEAMRGNLVSARDLMRGARDAWRRLGHASRMAGSHHEAGMIELLSEQWEAARGEFERGIAIQRATGDESLVPTSYFFLARALYGLELFDQAQAAVEDGRRLLPDAGDDIPDWGGTLAKVRARGGAVDEALQLVDRASIAVGASDDIHLRGDIALDRAEVSAIAGDRDDAVECALRAGSFYDLKGATASSVRARRFLERVRSG